MANVMVFVPAFGRQITATTFESTHHLMSAFMQKGIHASIGTFSWPDIAEIRNMMLSYWYDVMPDSTHFLFVDADMGFAPQMVLDMMAFGEPVVGAIYPKRTLPIEWAGSGVEGPEVRGGFLEVEGIGAGCLLIRRDAVTAMIEKFPELVFDYMTITDLALAGAKRTFGFFDPMRLDTGKVSEDIAFCRRWRETGGKVWASIGHRITHVGPWAFSACFAKEREESRETTLAVLSTVRCKHGLFKVNPNDAFIGRSMIEYGEWCDYEIDLLGPFIKPGDTVIDAGANIGTHAVPFASMVGATGRVFAFEPQSRLMTILKENIAANDPFEVIKPIMSALADFDGHMVMADLPPDNQVFNFGAVPLSAPGSSSTQVLTIDSLDVRPSLIKIDVEGMEPDVIHGAKKTIATCQPIIYLECNGDDTSAVDAVLKEIGYRAFWSVGPYFNPNNYRGNKNDLWPGVMPSANLIAVPNWSFDAMTVDLPQYLGADDNWRRVAVPKNKDAV